MKTKNLIFVVGARPNFVKIAPILRALEAYPSAKTTLVHTGQHYDPNLSDVFFDELNVRQPDVYLEVGSGKHGEQTAKVLEKMEATLEAGTSNGEPFDRLVVVGDVNSTMAATLAAVKLGIPVAHVEAGLRSFDRTMPEEINRIVTDSIADMLLVSEPAGIENLKNEGQPDENVRLVGNVMIDTLKASLPRAQSRDTLERFKLSLNQYGVVTLHRPANVDCPETLSKLVDVLVEVAETMPIVFPIHPRTRARLTDFGLIDRLTAAKGILDLPPLGYLDFLAITSRAHVIVTDSGGLQEEAAALEIPCLTMRPNTERPITVTEGTSTLIGSDVAMLRSCLKEVLDGKYKKGSCPALWDGKASERIAKILTNSN